MPHLADLHNHALFGVDDGAASMEITEAMLAMSYAEGVRVLCCTPHGDLMRFSASREKLLAHFAAVKELCQAKFPSLRLYLGNELFGYHDSVALLQGGRFFPLGEGRAALVEFRPEIDYRAMCNVMLSYLSAGYTPVLAHAEIYQCLLHSPQRVRELVAMRVCIQVNAETVCRRWWPSPAYRFVHKLLAADLVDVVASDGHDTQERPPCLLNAYHTVAKRYGPARAKRLFYETPQRLLAGQTERKTP